jgi:hypothetical protein
MSDDKVSRAAPTYNLKKIEEISNEWRCYQSASSAEIELLPIKPCSFHISMKMKGERYMGGCCSGC